MDILFLSHNIWDNVSSLEEMNRMAKVAQLEDPNIFDFDGTYELYKRPEKVSSQIAQKEAPKSRYVQNLKSTAAGAI